MALKTIQRMKPRSDFNRTAIVCDKAYVSRCTESLEILPPSDLHFAPIIPAFHWLLLGIIKTHEPTKYIGEIQLSYYTIRILEQY